MRPEPREVKRTATLIKFMRGKLEDPEKTEIANHLLECESCRNQYNELCDFFDEEALEKYREENPEKLKRAGEILRRASEKYKPK